MNIFKNIISWFKHPINNKKSTKNMSDTELIKELTILYDKLFVFCTDNTLQTYFNYCNVGDELSSRGYDIIESSTSVKVEKI